MRASRSRDSRKHVVEFPSDIVSLFIAALAGPDLEPLLAARLVSRRWLTASERELCQRTWWWHSQRYLFWRLTLGKAPILPFDILQRDELMSNAIGQKCLMAISPTRHAVQWLVAACERWLFLLTQDVVGFKLYGSDDERFSEIGDGSDGSWSPMMISSEESFEYYSDSDSDWEPYGAEAADQEFEALCSEWGTLYESKRRDWIELHLLMHHLCRLHDDFVGFEGNFWATDSTDDQVQHLQTIFDGLVERTIELCGDVSNLTAVDIRGKTPLDVLLESRHVHHMQANDNHMKAKAMPDPNPILKHLEAILKTILAGERGVELIEGMLDSWMLNMPADLAKTENQGWYFVIELLLRLLGRDFINEDFEVMDAPLKLGIMIKFVTMGSPMLPYRYYGEECLELYACGVGVLPAEESLLFDQLIRGALNQLEAGSGRRGWGGGCPKVIVVQDVATILSHAFDPSNIDGPLQ